MDLLFHKYSAGVINQFIDFEANKIKTCQNFGHFCPCWVLEARGKGVSFIPYSSPTLDESVCTVTR